MSGMTAAEARAEAIRYAEYAADPDVSTPEWTIAYAQIAQAYALLGGPIPDPGIVLPPIVDDRPARSFLVDLPPGMTPQEYADAHRLPHTLLDTLTGDTTP